MSGKIPRNNGYAEPVGSDIDPHDEVIEYTPDTAASLAAHHDFMNSENALNTEAFKREQNAEKHWLDHELHNGGKYHDAARRYEEQQELNAPHAKHLAKAQLQEILGDKEHDKGSRTRGVKQRTRRHNHHDSRPTGEGTGQYRVDGWEKHVDYVNRLEVQAREKAASAQERLEAEPGREPGSWTR